LQAAQHRRWRAAKSSTSSATCNLLYQHPDEVDPADFHPDLCAATKREIAPKAVTDVFLPLK
jgi:DNA gyrase inhibitor GyrI